MNQRNNDRSGDLKLSLMAAVIQVCQQTLSFVEFVHITGCLSFSIDNAEKLDVVFSEMVGASSPASVPADKEVPPPSFAKPEMPKKPRRGRQRKGRSDTEEDVNFQPNTRGQKDVLKSPDEDKNELKELVKTTDLFQIIPVDREAVPSSGQSVNTEPVHLVLDNLSSPSELLAKETDNTVTKSNGHNDFMTDVAGNHSSLVKCDKSVPSQTCVTCNKSFVSTAELKRHVTQVHPRLFKCPQCLEQFSTSVKVRKHKKVAHGVDGDMVPCQSCSQSSRIYHCRTVDGAQRFEGQRNEVMCGGESEILDDRWRFVTSELLQEHIRSKHKKVCTICKATFTDQRKLIAHRRSEHPDAELDCVCCGHRCPTRDALRKHMFGHRDHRQYKCDACEKRFTSGSTLYHHRRAMHGDRKPYQCKICGVSFNFNNSMKLHMLRHGGLRPHQCTVCNKSYLTASHLKHHVRAVHDESRPFRCSTCGKTFPYENSLCLHRMLHTGERPFTCSFCGKSFVSRSALRAHEESHAESAAYACDVCRKSYKTASLLRAHRRRHTSDGERFICDVCGQRFMYRSNLETHCSVHSDARLHGCRTCDKRFKTYAALYSHLQVHLPSSPFVCPKCEKSFKTKERLRAHENRHLGQKSFVCQLCNNAFPDKGGLTKHAKSVHAVKPRYACPACSKTCNRADNLRVHMRVHGNPELLKLSLQDLTVAELEEIPPQAENSILRAAANFLAPLESAPVMELVSTNALSSDMTQNDHQCLQTLGNHATVGSSLNLLVNSGNDSYSSNILGLFTCPNHYDLRPFSGV